MEPSWLASGEVAYVTACRGEGGSGDGPCSSITERGTCEPSSTRGRRAKLRRSRFEKVAKAWASRERDRFGHRVAGAR